MSLRVVSPEQWLTARKELLARETELVRATEAVAAARSSLPAVEIDREYVFEGPDGEASLLDLFEGRQQLIVQVFMYEPDWDEGCKHCSYLTDSHPRPEHLNALNTTYAMVSPAPVEKIEPFRKRMGWTMPWYSSRGGLFHYDFPVASAVGAEDEAARELAGEWFGAGQMDGMVVFTREGDRVFHTYSSFGDRLDLLNNAYAYLELTPLGRQDTSDRAWLHHHDRYPSAS
jgi:predicted dithiol-disulfide oxidoreductase (DUF899 family)